MKKKILIFGNLGYVGSKLSEVLNYKKFETYGVDIGLFENCTFYKNFKEKKIMQYYDDVRKLNYSLLKDKDIIVYLAAISNDPMGEKFKKITQEINYKSCIKIAKKAKKFGCKSFIFASSCSVYGTKGKKLKKEKHKLNPLTVYAKSKILCEQELKKISSKKFKVFCLRFATACGESSRLRLDLVLNDFVYSAVKQKCINILSDGKPFRPLIDVKDMAKAIKFGFNYDSIKRNFICVNVGSNKWNFTVLEIAKKVSKVFGGIKINLLSERPSDKRSYKVDFSEFKKIAPDFFPKIKIEDTIKNLKKVIERKNTKKENYIRLNILDKRIKQNFMKL